MVKHPAIIALGVAEAAEYLRSSKGPGVVAIISIHGVGERGVESKMARRLDLEFDDVDADAGDPMDLVVMYQTIVRKQVKEETGRDLRPPTSDDAVQIIQFAQSIKGLDGTVLCHCRAGVSRSTAAALVCLAAWTSVGEEEYCVEYLMRCRAGATPHPDLVRFGDIALGRRGRLVGALAFRSPGRPEPGMGD